MATELQRGIVGGAREEARLVRRVTLAGVVVALASLAGLFGPALDMPSSDAAASAFADHYRSERSAVLVTCYLAVLGAAFLLPVLVGLRHLLARDSRWLADIGLVGGAFTFALVSTGMAVFATAAYRTPGPETAQVLTDLGWVMLNLAAGPCTVVAVGGFTLALLKSWTVRRLPIAAIAVATIIAHLIVPASFARSGFFSPEGGIAVLAPALYYAWLTVLCLTLLRAGAAAERTIAASASTR